MTSVTTVARLRRPPHPPGAVRATSTRLVAGFQLRSADLGLTFPCPVSQGRLVVDLSRYSVQMDGRDVAVSPRQAELLAVFLADPTRVWSREQLHWVCWGDTRPSRRVDVQLCRLRAKTGLDLFRNVRDRGWALHPMR